MMQKTLLAAYVVNDGRVEQTWFYVCVDAICSFFEWFFTSPTPIIAILSLIVAYIAYRYQRKERRKYNAFEIAQWYAKDILPRMRYLDKLLDLAEAKEIISHFETVKDFTQAELEDILKTQGKSKDDFDNKLKQSMNADMLSKCFCYSGGSEQVKRYHEMLIKQTDVEVSLDIIYRFVMDMLNEVEVIAIAFRCRIAEEELVYQAMHQTFMRHIGNWYLFMSYKNYLGADRYFANISWLYSTWKQRAKEDNQRVQKVLSKINRPMPV